MHRFQLTSEKFKGTAEAWYNDNGMLCRLDFVTCDLNFKQIKYLLENSSPEIETFKGLLTGTGLEIKEVPFDITVDDFLREYPYQRNTHLVRELWPKLDRKVQVRAFFAAMEYREYCNRNDWYKPQIPNTWLTKKQYLNNWKNA
ncbi:MAG: hypothetical protein ACT4OJ_08700 [Bacteroidota bacterium]